MDFISAAGDALWSGYMWIGTLNMWQYFLFSAVVFTPLAFAFPNKPGQPVFRKDTLTDLVYWFMVPIIYTPVRLLIIGLIVGFGIRSVEDINRISVSGMTPLSDLPIWAQTVIVFLLYDIIQYWTHRLFHTGQWWRFHAIHHAPQEIDWMTSARFHPVNFSIHSILVGTIIFLLGFSPAVWAISASFNIIYSPLVHANLNWTYGPFRYFLASPVFHRWHHTHEEEGGNSNFAPTFPFLDILFGTYYDPKDKKPQIFGAPNDPVPHDILGQVIYPFKAIFSK